MKTKDILADFEFQDIINIVRKRKLLPADEIIDDEKVKYDYIGLIVYDQKISEHTKIYFQSLSWDEKQLLMYILSEGGVIEGDFLLKAYFEGNQEHFDKLISNLLSWGLIYYDPFYIKNFDLKLYGIPETYHDYVRVPIYLEGKLGYYLNRYSNSILLALESTISDEPLKCQFRDYIIYKLKKELLTPEKIDENLKKLPLLKRKAVNIVTQNGGQMWFSDILKKMGMDKKPESAVRNVIWNNPFLYIILDKKKDFLIQIPIDIYYLLKNRDDFLYFTFQQSLKLFINDTNLKSNEAISNYSDWFTDVIYIINTIQNKETGSILYRGFSKKKHFFVNSQEYKGVPYIVYWLVLMGISDYLDIEGENFSINDSFYQDISYIEKMIMKFFNRWSDNYLSIEVFDKKYLRLKKLEESAKIDSLHLKPIKANLIRLLSDLDSEQPIRIDSFLKLFFDYYKIDTYYSSFDYDQGNFLNMSVEQLELINNIIKGPLFWIGAIEIYNKEKIDFFFDQIIKQMSSKQTLNQLIKNNEIRKIDGFFKVTSWGKKLFDNALKKDDYFINSSGLEEICVDKNNQVVKVPFSFPLKKLIELLELGIIQDVRDNYFFIHLEPEKTKEKGKDILKRLNQYCKNNIELTAMIKGAKEIDHPDIFLDNYKGIWILRNELDEVTLEKIREKDGMVYPADCFYIISFKKRDSVEWAKKNLPLEQDKLVKL